MRDEILGPVRAAGMELVAVGSGTREMAEDFVADHHIDFPVLVDPEREAYQALSLVRSRRSTLGPKAMAHAVRAMRKGFRQTKVLGDPYQQGGVFLVTPEGEMPYAYLSKEAGDHPDPKAVVAAVEAQAAR